MKNLIMICFLSGLIFLISVCADFVEDVDPLISSVEDELLTDESQIPFLITGIKVRFANPVHDNLMALAAALSDEMFFDTNVPDATDPNLGEIDKGQIDLNNGALLNPFRFLGELRFVTDALLVRIERIDFTDAQLENQARYVAHLYGGITRYLYATYFSLDETTPGGVIDAGPFIPAAEMYELALEKWQDALRFAVTPAESRVVSSLIARLYLYAGDAVQARAFAEQGMVAGDEPLQSRYSTISPNFFWENAGLGRPQLVVDQRFFAYGQADSSERVRLPLSEIMGSDDQTVYYRQTKYPLPESPLAFMTWEENELILAELELTTNPISALDRINRVRASHGLAAFVPETGVLTLDDLMTERDKELWLTGARMVDQNRFGLWHLPEGHWRYLPIPQEERNANPFID